MKMRFLPDEPIADSLEDLLGFGDLVRLIQTSIYHTKTPFVYGVLGDWGSGKTSILRLLECLLDEDFMNSAHPFVPIWFNAWQYENEANIVYPLLHAIKRDYDRRVGAFDELKEFGKKFLQVVVTSTLALTDLGLRVVTKYFTDEGLKLEDIADHLKSIQEHPSELQRVLDGWVDQVTKLQSTFETLLDIYAGELAALHSGIAKDDVRFVILIDDLDRCLPETAIAVLESIKNHLSVKNCVFVLGLNSRVIYQGIRIKYQGLEIDGREYLEKILNYSFYIPEPEPDRVAAFATSQLERLVLEDEQREQYRELFAEFGQVLQECHFNNPRKIKRILNRYLLFLSKYTGFVSEYEEESFYNHGVVRLIIIAEYYPDIFQLFLKSYRDDRDLLLKLADIHSDRFDVKGFEERFGISIASRYLQLSQRRRLFDFTNLNSDTFSLAQDVFTITRVS
jgi:hypothetical protein